MPATSTRFVWQMPVGLPNAGSITINNGNDFTFNPTVTVRPVVRSASVIRLFETGGFAAATDEDLARTHSFTFSGTGLHTLYAAFRNPAGYWIGDDESISASITVDDTLPNGLIAKIHADIVWILRNDATLQAYDTDWSSTTKPHVIPGWSSGDEVVEIGAANKGRFPCLEVGVGPHGVSEPVPPGSRYEFDVHFPIRGFIKVAKDPVDPNREAVPSKLLEDIMHALAAYPELRSNLYVLGHFPATMNPRLADDSSARVVLYDLVVSADQIVKEFC